MLDAIKNFILWFRSLFYTVPEGMPTPNEWVRLRKETTAIAESMGKSDLPTKCATELCDHELKILRLATKEKNYLTRVLERETEATIHRLASFSPQLLIADLKNEASITITNFRAAMQIHTREVFSKKKEYDSRMRELDRFRTENKLKHDSNHPKSSILHISVLLAILLMEMISNSYFFMAAHPLGFVGAFFQALMIAAIGIFIAWITSVFYRKAIHINVAAKIFFGLAALVSLVFLIGFVLLIGHLRDFQHANPTSTLTALDPKFFYNRLINEPFIFLSVDSYIMTCIIAIFSIVAVIDFFKMDDPYPGYGEVARKAQEADEELKEAIKSQTILLKEGLDKATESMRERNRIVEVKLNQQATIISIYDLKAQQFVKDVEYLKNNSNDMLQEFRKINISSRSTEAPQYFHSHIIEFDNPKPSEVKPILSGEKLQDLQETFARTIEDTNSQIISVYLESDKHLTKLHLHE